MSSEDKYARGIARVVAGQLMAAQGLDSAQRSTIEILADLLLRYISEVGSQSHMYAELSHRSECSSTDVATALKNMGHTLPSLLQYAKRLDDAPLVQNVAEFPVAKGVPRQDTFAARGEAPPPHIPAFLPAFPDPHTLMETAKYVHKEHTTASRAAALTEQQQAGEEALLRVEAREHPDSAPLQSAKQRLDAAAAEEGGKGEGAADGAAAAAQDNPFLAPVLWETAAAGVAPGAAPAAPAGPAAEAAWTVPEGDTGAGPGLDLNFDGFKVGPAARVTLATSGRSYVPDAYAGEEAEAAVAPGARRRRLATTAADARVQQILSARAEDAEMALGADEVAAMDHEMI